MPTEEPQIPVSTAPSVTASLPTSPASSAPLVSPTHSDSAGPSTLAALLQHISLSPQDFLAIMNAVRNILATSASFTTAHIALVERMVRIEAAVAQTTTMLAQNNAILMQIKSHLGLPQIPSLVPTQASLTHPPTTHLASPSVSLDILTVAAAVDPPPTSSTAPQPA